MNILLIGNGFDLAHDLPTSYMDFLNFVKEFEICNSGNAVDQSSISGIELKDTVILYLNSLFATGNDRNTAIIDELSEMTANNFWIQHFNKITRNRNWVDFESEISTVVKNLDELRHSIRERRPHGDRGVLLNRQQIDIISYLWPEEKISQAETYFSQEKIKSKSDTLLNDLNRLIRALEIYLADCVNAIKPNKISPDISDIKVDCLLSFNYTNTFEHLYTEIGKNGENKSVVCDFLHGKAKIDTNVDNSNLVLGIDEYLDEPDRTNDNEYIRFKKFFQRIHKKTGCEYLSWIEMVNTNPTRKWSNPVRDNLYIFGHSLDVTDGEVLRNLMLTKSIYTTIFYYSREAYARQIANLVRVLGEDNLISMVYGKEPKIKFVEQKAMVSC